MDVPRRKAGLCRVGCNPQTNASQSYQVPGRPPVNPRNHPTSQAPSSSHAKLQRSASNQVTTRTSDSTRNNAPIPYPDSCASGHTNVGSLPGSAAIITQRYAFRNEVSLDTQRGGQTAAKPPTKDRCATTLRSAYGDSLLDSVNFGQRADDEVFVSQSREVEGARCFRTVGDHNKVPDVRTTPGLQRRYVGDPSKLNYIDPKLVQKVLACQKTRAQTPVGQPQSYNREVPRISAGQNGARFEKPEHHSSDTSLSNRLTDCRVTDPETVSTGSQRESGYHSGDSVGDRLSENSEPGRNTRWGPTVTQPSPGIPGAPDDVCEHYFLKGESLMDLCNEQERFGNWPQALSFLNQAIDFFQQATNVSGVSHDNVLRMRLKHNRAVLHRRKLLKQSGCSTETRRLPCTPQEVKESSTVEHDLPIRDRFTKVAICTDYGDDTRNMGMGFDRRPPLYPDYGTGNVDFAEGGNCDNVNLGKCNPDLPEAGLQWTSDDVKDIRIYATLPKNRRRDGAGVTNIINPVQTNSQSETLAVSRNEEYQHQSRNTSGQRATDGGCGYQQVPNRCRRIGSVQSREPARERVMRTPCAEASQLQDSLSHNFRSNDVNVRRTGGSTSVQAKFIW